MIINASGFETDYEVKRSSESTVASITLSLLAGCFFRWLASLCASPATGYLVQDTMHTRSLVKLAVGPKVAPLVAGTVYMGTTGTMSSISV